MPQVSRHPRRNVLSAAPPQIRQARHRILVLEACGLSRREIAKRAGVAPSTVTRVANGQIEVLTKRAANALLAVRPS